MTLAVLAVPVLVTIAPRTAQADEPTAAPVAAPTVAPAPATAPAGPAAAPATTVVQLDADDQRATIERRIGTQSPSGLPLLETGIVSVGQWEHACVAPCTVKLDPRYAYRVAGDGLVPTDSFVLPPQRRWRARRCEDGLVDGPRRRRRSRRAPASLAIAAGGLALIATPILASEDVGSEGFRTGVLAGGVGAVSVGVVAVGDRHVLVVHQRVDGAPADRIALNRTTTGNFSLHPRIFAGVFP